MLIRIVVNNIFSFGDLKEFNLIPNTRFRTLQNHINTFNNFGVLKMSSIYGANGAGKSNLVKAIDLLQKVILTEELPFSLRSSHFKFQDDPKTSKQLIAIEFIQDEVAFYYALEISKGIITTEELYESGLGTKEDKLIFERKTDENENTTITFLKDFEDDEKGKILKEVLLEDFVRPNSPVLKLISKRDNVHLNLVKKAYNWFSQTLNVITPNSKPRALSQRIDTDPDFKIYAEEIMCSFNIGITALRSEKIEAKEFFGQDNESEIDELIKKLEESPNTKMIGLRSRGGEELILVKEGDQAVIKQLKLDHTGKDNIVATFNLEDESDGTVRLLDFIPAFRNVTSKNKVYIVDEIERSIHPLLIKELIKKFSHDELSKGQLIFTTHESNLLDQEIFRQDEIWFAEKDKNGATDLYSLSDFKEHKTIDIRKGYLNGRYGSIPFLANLNDLNWHINDINE